MSRKLFQSAAKIQGYPNGYNNFSEFVDDVNIYVGRVVALCKKFSSSDEFWETGFEHPKMIRHYKLVAHGKTIGHIPFEILRSPKRRSE